MRPFVLSMLFLSCGPATPGTWDGPPLATVRGTLISVPGRVVPEPLRVSVVWNGKTTLAHPLDDLLWSPWPRHFEVPLTALPSSEELAPTDGGSTARGLVVAWSDLNGDGVLQLSMDGGVGDVIVGSSWTPDGGGIELRFVKGAPPQTPAGLLPGFNLITDGTDLTAFATNVEVLLTADTGLRTLFCPECEVQAPERLILVGTVGLSSGTSATFLEVRDPLGALSDARVTLNGTAVPFDATQRKYVLKTSSALVQAAALNRLEVSSPGHRSVVWDVPVPPRPTLVKPTFGQQFAVGASIAVEWTAPPSTPAPEFEVRVYAPPFQRVFSGKTFSTSLTTAPITTVGDHVVNVEAETRLDTPQGDLLLGYVNEGVSIRVQ